jgi:hypothetical protein
MPLFRLDIFWHFLQLKSRFVGTKHLLHMHIWFPEKNAHYDISWGQILQGCVHIQSNTFRSTHYDIYTCIIMNYIPQYWHAKVMHLRRRWRWRCTSCRLCLARVWPGSGTSSTSSALLMSKPPSSPRMLSLVPPARRQAPHWEVKHGGADVGLGSLALISSRRR